MQNIPYGQRMSNLTATNSLKQGSIIHILRRDTRHAHSSTSQGIWQQYLKNRDTWGRRHAPVCLHDLGVAVSQSCNCNTLSSAHLARGQLVVLLCSVFWQPAVELVHPVVQHIAGNQQQRALVGPVGMEGMQECNGLQGFAQAHGVSQDDPNGIISLLSSRLCLTTGQSKSVLLFPCPLMLVQAKRKLGSQKP